MVALQHLGHGREAFDQLALAGLRHVDANHRAHAIAQRGGRHLGAHAGDDAGFLQPFDALGRGRQRKAGRLRQRLERLAPVGLQGLQQPPGLVVELQHGGFFKSLRMPSIFLQHRRLA